MSDDQTSVKISTEDDVTLVTFGSVSISGAGDVEKVSKQVDTFISENHPGKIVFDFQQVKFLSSLALGLLLKAWQRLQEYDGRVVISGIDPQLHRVFKITNLDKIFKFFPNPQSAIDALHAG